MGEENKSLKEEKEKYPIVMDKFKGQEHTIKELTDKIQSLELTNK